MPVIYCCYYAAAFGLHLYLEASVDEETLKKVVLHSVATALASMVFPVPGGPNIRTPCSIIMRRRVDGRGNERAGVGLCNMSCSSHGRLSYPSGRTGRATGVVV